MLVWGHCKGPQRLVAQAWLAKPLTEWHKEQGGRRAITRSWQWPVQLRSEVPGLLKGLGCALLLGARWGEKKLMSASALARRIVGAQGHILIAAGCICKQAAAGLTSEVT